MRKPMSPEVKEHTDHLGLPQLREKRLSHENRSAKVTPAEFYAELTNPRTHDPSSYRYIVHGINPEAKNGLLINVLTQEGYDPSQEINLLAEPNRIVEKKLISTSFSFQ
ncbi:MAG: hypothetical protein KDD62_02495 [Bdellovibrionales bacterium]|nr:hypothetical protein [Bdellovibrionales bacterium]